MSDTGWWGDKIIVVLQSDGRRRHKKWCKHYRCGNCDVRYCKCVGSAFCERYVDDIHEEEPIWVQPRCGAEIKIPPEERRERRTQRIEFYRLATPTEKLLGKIVLIKNTPYTLRIGAVISEDFHTGIFSVRYDGGIHKFDRKIANRNKAIYIYEEGKCHFTYDDEEIL